MIALLPLQRYFDFQGRSARTEYWLFWLVYLGINTVAYALDAAIFGTGDDMGIIRGLAGLAILIPGFGVAVRRLHDIDRTGWWVLLVFASIIGWIVLLVFFCTDGTPGPNRFGSDPKNAESDLAEVFR